MKGEFFRKMKQPNKAFMEYGKVIDIEVDISNRGYYVTAQDNAYQELYAYVEAISRVLR